MARSEEQALRDAIASDILYMFQRGDGWLMKDEKSPENLGKYAAVLGYCRKIIEKREMERQLKKESP